MPLINFYGVDATVNVNKSLFQVLIKLLGKAVENKKNSIIFSQSLNFLQEVDDFLWCSANWLPHALVSDPFNEKQHILLTTTLNNINNSKFLFILDNSLFSSLLDWEKVCFIFNLNSVEDSNTFNNRWKDLQKSGFDLQYFKQDKQGKFQNVIP